MLVDPNDVSLLSLYLQLSTMRRHIGVVVSLNNVSDHVPTAVKLHTNWAKQHLYRLADTLKGCQLAFLERSGEGRYFLAETEVFLHRKEVVKQN
jgi:hypothetical protein